jgi:hypothetical protein
MPKSQNIEQKTQHPLQPLCAAAAGVAMFHCFAIFKVSMLREFSLIPPTA